MSFNFAVTLLLAFYFEIITDSQEVAKIVQSLL